MRTQVASPPVRAACFVALAFLGATSLAGGPAPAGAVASVLADPPSPFLLGLAIPMTRR